MSNRNGSRWLMPVVTAVLGLGLCGAAVVGGHAQLGLEMFIFLVVVAVALFVLGPRSETLRGLGEGRDERFSLIDLKATAFSGVVLISVCVGAVIVETARGHSGEPYMYLAAVAGIAYIASVIFQRLRG